MTRPATEAFPSVYSNFDHEFELDTVRELAANPNERFAQHAAWDFCGYVWYDGEQWHDEVWIYREHEHTYSDHNLVDLIERVNFNHGFK